MAYTSCCGAFSNEKNKKWIIDIDHKNINEITTITLKEIMVIHEENKYFRQSISSLDMNDLSYDRKIENLTMRVEKLELNAK